LREGDGRLPLFLINGDRANELLPRLLPPEQTLYGYAHQGANGEPIRLKSIEALAARCLEEWTAVNGNAPCILAGHSYGATVAYHLAYLLRSRDVVVPHLYLLDGGHPRVARSCYRFGPKWPVRFAKNAVERLQDLKTIQRAEEYHLRSERVPPEARTSYTMAIYNLGQFRYLPPTIDVETTLFRASRNFSGLSHNGWNPADFTSLRVIHVPGDHLEMVRNEDSFKAVAEVLLSDLERLRAQKT
jgi:thioesterase domain-containing protein